MSDDHIEDNFQWKKDYFDGTYGIEDFGYGSVPTDDQASQALAAIEAATIPDYHCLRIMNIRFLTS